MKFALLAAGWLAASLNALPVHAQPPGPAPPRRLRLHLDCPDGACDFDFLKRELAWVDWVHDRADADVSVLLATRDTGSGGTEATYFVSRPRGGGPASDTLRVFSPVTASGDAARRQIARTLAAALARDVAIRPEGEGLSLTLTSPEGRPTDAPPPRDPWNHWVYKIGTNGYLNGESSYRSYYLYSTLSASRVTETRKMGLSVGQSYSENRYRFDDGSSFTSLTRSWNTRGLYVKSLTPHWSAGASAGASSSSFANQDLNARVGPAIEYDVWPYSESARRSLTFGWQLNTSWVDYRDVTLYDRTSEWLVSHELTTTLVQRQPWGTLDVGVTGSQYVHDGTKYRVTVNTNADLKLWRGFSLEGYLYAARIRDQLSLRRGDASESEVIARQRQLATAYEYYASFGVTYRFGSIFDSVVNDRLKNTLGAL